MENDVSDILVDSLISESGAFFPMVKYETKMCYLGEREC